MKRKSGIGGRDRGGECDIWGLFPFLFFLYDSIIIPTHFHPLSLSLPHFLHQVKERERERERERKERREWIILWSISFSISIEFSVDWRFSPIWIKGTFAGSSSSWRLALRSHSQDIPQTTIPIIFGKWNPKPSQNRTGRKGLHPTGKGKRRKK